MESQRSDDHMLAQQLLERLLPHSGQAIRVGITGVPGVEKSTLLDSLGMMLIERGHRVAVLAVDPASVFRVAVSWVTRHEWHALQNRITHLFARLD